MLGRSLLCQHQAIMRNVALLLITGILGAPLVVVRAQDFHVAAADEMKSFEPTITKVLKDAGVHPVFDYYPLPRALMMLRDGKCNGIYPVSETAIAEVPGARAVPVPLIQFDVVALSVEAGIAVRSVEDLKKYSVGVVRGNRTHHALTRETNTQEARDYVNLIDMLSSHRVQVVLVPSALIPKLAKRAGMTDYTVHQPPLAYVPQYFAVQADAADKIPTLADAFRKAVKSGQWQHDINAALRPPN